MDGDLTRWLEHRRAEDREQQYHTQLATLEAALREGIRAVREDIGAIDGNARRAVVYARCREADKETVFLRRYWEYFASKWAQRDRDGETRDTLLAAEEIIWSRWDRVQGVGDPGGGRVAAVPGTRIRSIGASAHGPSASAARRDLLAAAVGALPLPLIALPPICRERPWWLMHVAHEMGHHVHGRGGR